MSSFWRRYWHSLTGSGPLPANSQPQRQPEATWFRRFLRKLFG